MALQQEQSETSLGHIRENGKSQQQKINTQKDEFQSRKEKIIY